MNPAYQVIEAPSILGLKPTGVELLPYALQRNGFLRHSPPALLVPVEVAAFSPHRASRQEVLNTPALAAYSRQLADVVQQVRARKQVPVVLGGDCSVLLGCMLALKREGTFGLAHVDAHADFYEPAAEPLGEAASMDLALVVGRGPQALTDIGNQRPYVLEEHVTQIGQRDADEARAAGSPDIKDSRVHSFDLASVRAQGLRAVAASAVQVLTQPGLAGHWIHFDVDVLADEIMPAVDYRLPGGLSFAEASELLRLLLHTTKAAGLSITIFNPKLDADGHLTRELVECLHRGLLADANP